MTRTGAKKKEYAYGVGPSSNTLSFMTKNIVPLLSITWPPAQFEDHHLPSHRLSSVLLSVSACEQKNTYYRPLCSRPRRDLPCVAGQSACRRMTGQDPLCGEGEVSAQDSEFCSLCLLFFSRVLTCSHFLSLLLPQF